MSSGRNLGRGRGATPGLLNILIVGHIVPLLVAMCMCVFRAISTICNDTPSGGGCNVLP